MAEVAKPYISNPAIAKRLHKVRHTEEAHRSNLSADEASAFQVLRQSSVGELATIEKRDRLAHSRLLEFAKRYEDELERERERQAVQGRLAEELKAQQEEYARSRSRSPVSTCDGASASVNASSQSCCASPSAKRVGWLVAQKRMTAANVREQSKQIQQAAKEADNSGATVRGDKPSNVLASERLRLERTEESHRQNVLANAATAFLTLSEHLTTEWETAVKRDKLLEERRREEAARQEKVQHRLTQPASSPSETSYLEIREVRHPHARANRGKAAKRIAQLLAQKRSLALEVRAYSSQMVEDVHAHSAQLAQGASSDNAASSAVRDDDECVAFTTRLHKVRHTEEAHRSNLSADEASAFQVLRQSSVGELATIEKRDRLAHSRLLEFAKRYEGELERERERQAVQGRLAEELKAQQEEYARSRSRSPVSTCDGASASVNASSQSCCASPSAKRVGWLVAQKRMTAANVREQSKQIQQAAKEADNSGATVRGDKPSNVLASERLRLERTEESHRQNVLANAATAFLTLSEHLTTEWETAVKRDKLLEERRREEAARQEKELQLTKLLQCTEEKALRQIEDQRQKVADAAHSSPRRLPEIPTDGYPWIPDATRRARALLAKSQSAAEDVHAHSAQLAQGASSDNAASSAVRDDDECVAFTTRLHKVRHTEEAHRSNLSADEASAFQVLRQSSVGELATIEKRDRLAHSRLLEFAKRYEGDLERERERQAVQGRLADELKAQQEEYARSRSRSPVSTCDGASASVNASSQSCCASPVAQKRMTAANVREQSKQIQQAAKEADNSGATVRGDKPSNVLASERLRLERTEESHRQNVLANAATAFLTLSEHLTTEWETAVKRDKLLEERRREEAARQEKELQLTKLLQRTEEKALRQIEDQRQKVADAAHSSPRRLPEIPTDGYPWIPDATRRARALLAKSQSAAEDVHAHSAQLAQGASSDNAASSAVRDDDECVAFTTRLHKVRHTEEAHRSNLSADEASAFQVLRQSSVGELATIEKRDRLAHSRLLEFAKRYEGELERERERQAVQGRLAEELKAQQEEYARSRSRSPVSTCDGASASVNASSQSCCASPSAKRVGWLVAQKRMTAANVREQSKQIQQAAKEADNSGATVRGDKPSNVLASERLRLERTEESHRQNVLANAATAFLTLSEHLTTEWETAVKRDKLLEERRREEAARQEKELQLTKLLQRTEEKALRQIEDQRQKVADAAHSSPRRLPEIPKDGYPWIPDATRRARALLEQRRRVAKGLL